MIAGGRGLAGRTLRLYLPLAFFLVAMLFPFYWMAITSIKPNRELYSQKIMPLVVHQPTLKHYVDLFDQTNFLTWTYNTMLVAVVTTVISLVLGVMMAYPLARMNFPGAALGRHLRVHARAERVPLRADLPDQERGTHGARRRHHRAHSRRRLLLGPAHGRRAARLGAGRGHLLVLRRLLRRRPHRGLGQEL